jgi:HD superfamily phosphohydrolase YqeK
MDGETRMIPAVWHGWAAAAEARHRSGMRDREILEAVRWHSTGRAGMSALGKILFVADFCSRDRKFPGAAVGRRLARKGINLGVRYVLASKLAHLMECGIRPHSAALGFWRSLFLEVAAG